VLPPSEDFSIEGELLATDVSKAADTNDPSLAADMAAKLASQDAMRKAAAVAAPPAPTPPLDGRRLLEAGSGGGSGGSGSGSEVDAVVQAKVVQLLSIVAQYAEDTTADAATQRQLAASAFQLMGTQQGVTLPSGTLADVRAVVGSSFAAFALSGRAAGVDGSYATALLTLISRGLQLPPLAAQGSGVALESGSSGGPYRRRLLAPAGGGGVPLVPSAPEAVGAAVSALDSLAAGMVGAAGPGTGWLSAKSEDGSLLASVAKETGGAYAGYTLAVGPALGASPLAGDYQQANATDAANARLTINAALADLDDGGTRLFLQMAANPAVFVSELPDASEGVVAAYKAALADADAPQLPPPLAGLSLLTPAVRLLLPAADTGDALLACAGGPDAPECTATLTLPLLAGATVNTSRRLVCLRAPSAGGGLSASVPDVADAWVVDANATTGDAVACTIRKQGIYMAATVDLILPDPPAAPPPAPDGGSGTNETSPLPSPLLFESPTPAPPPPSPQPEPPLEGLSPSPPASPSPQPASQPPQPPQPPAVASLRGQLLNLGGVTGCPVSAAVALGLQAEHLCSCAARAQSGARTCRHTDTPTQTHMLHTTTKPTNRARTWPTALAAAGRCRPTTPGPSAWTHPLAPPTRLPPPPATPAASTACRAAGWRSPTCSRCLRCQRRASQPCRC
jgi:hypothetical protein